MKDCIRLAFSLWLGIIGTTLGMIGVSGVWISKWIKVGGEAIIDYSFKFDDF